MIHDHDKRQIYCRKLGHCLAFLYCRTQEGASICPSILNCWWEAFDVEGFLRAHLTPERFAALLQYRPKPRLTSILEILERVRQDVGDVSKPAR